MKEADRESRSSSAKGTLRWISRIAGRKKIYIVILLMLQIILGISGVVYAILLRSGIDRAVAGDLDGGIRYFMFFVLLILLQILSSAASRFMDEYARSGYENCFKSRLFDQLLWGRYEEVTGVHSGEWMNRLTSDTVVVAEGLTTIVPGLVGMLVKLAGALMAILILEPRLCLILLVCGSIMLVVSYLFRRSLKKLHKKMQEEDGKVRSFLQEHLGGLLVIKAFAREDDVLEEAERYMAGHRRARMKRNHFSNLCNIGFAAAMNGAYVLGVGYCGYGILRGDISYGTFLAVIQLIAQIQAPFANITGYLPRFYAAIASAERLMEAEEMSERQEKEEGLDTVTKGLSFETEDGNTGSFYAVGFDKVAFSYTGGDPVLSSADIEIKRGDYIAFTGESGCGKSTMMKLLLALYTPQAGECYLLQNEGEVRRRLTAHERGLFAYVPQGNMLMSGTIREVVVFGADTEDIPEDRLWEALRIACADTFVEELPDGVDTLLGERGTGLSEGQMQRLAIARALYTQHPVLLLDEATSALDEETELRLLQNLRRMTDRTVLIVTHRPAALEICDRVYDCENNNAVTGFFRKDD